MARSTTSSTPTCHFWDASRENWKPGREQYAKGWIDCFYGYHQLAPPETHWDYEHYLKVSRRGLRCRTCSRRLRRQGRSSSRRTSRSGTPRASTPPTERRARTEKHPDKFIVNGRFDPREGDAGLKQLEEDAKKWNLKGVKLYTAEWHDGSRGWRLTRPEAYRFLEKCQELGIKNIHVHKGPTIWPLDKDAFDVGRHRPRRDRLPGAQLHRRARGHARASRTSASWRCRSPTSTRACRWSSAA